MIGSLGGVVFEASSELVRTFRDLSQKRAAKYAEHAVHGGKAKLEFISLELTSATFNVRIDASLGVDPRAELRALRAILEGHEAVAFILDGEPQGTGLWAVTALDEDHEVVGAHGETRAVDVSVTLREYV
ncbi:MAG: phage tail protein [Synergistaceae bacterium]|nr:phage tail protein [Synergistaceae bacterium]